MVGNSHMLFSTDVFIFCKPSGLHFYTLQSELRIYQVGTVGVFRVAEIDSCLKKWGGSKKTEGVLVGKWPDDGGEAREATQEAPGDRLRPSPDRPPDS